MKNSENIQSTSIAELVEVMKSNTKYINTEFGRISYNDEGEGHPVVFIHANSSAKEFFVKQYSAFSASYKFIAVDLPGHGKSDNPNNPKETYSFQGYAKVISNILQELNISNSNKAIICGWSLGGHVAMDVLDQSPELIAGLLITGSPPIELTPEGFQQGFKPFEGVELMSQEINFSSEQATRFFEMAGINTKGTPYLVEAGVRCDGQARSLMIKSALSGVGVNEKDLVKNSSTPIKFVGGQNDEGINYEYIAKLVESSNNQNLSIEMIQNCGHACHWQAPEEFNEILLSFCNSIFETNS
ncbi:MAG: epoxide hydrolase [Rickettsiaceae bacterium]|jgi:pimeloyl-ACP methyl ester carboxylesterase|nr:epoxide hydrolase [Rickettsiaceae bacterium]